MPVERGPSSARGRAALTGWRRSVWWAVAICVLGLSLAFLLFEVPDWIQREFTLSTRILVSLGPPVAFAYSSVPAMLLVGILGDTVVLWACRRALRANSAVVAAFWAFGMVVMWTLFGLIAAAPAV